MFPALLDMFCMAVLLAFDLFDMFDDVIAAYWLDVAPEAMVIVDGDTGPAAMAAAANALSAKNASFFMMSSPKTKLKICLVSASFVRSF